LRDGGKPAGGNQFVVVEKRHQIARSHRDAGVEGVRLPRPAFYAVVQPRVEIGGYLSDDLGGLVRRVVVDDEDADGHPVRRGSTEQASQQLAQKWSAIVGGDDDIEGGRG